MEGATAEEIELYSPTTFVLKVIVFILIVIYDINSKIIVAFSSPSSLAKVHMHQ